MRCKVNQISSLSSVLQLTILSGITRLVVSQELLPFTLKDAQTNYQVKFGFKQLQGEPRLENHPKLNPDDSELKTAKSRYTKESTPDLSQGYSFQLMNKSGSGEIDLIDDMDFKFNKETFLNESSKESVVMANHTRQVRPKKGKMNSRNGGGTSSNPTRLLTPKGRYKHYRVRPTSGSDLQELKVDGNKHPRTYRRYRIRKNVRSEIESEKHDQAEKIQYPRVRYQNQYIRPKDSVLQRGILIKSSQPLINYTLPTLEPDFNSTKVYGKGDEANHQGERDQIETSSSSHHSIHISGKTSEGSGLRVTKDVRKDGVTSFTPIINNKNNIPSKGIKSSITHSSPVYANVGNIRKPSNGLTASLCSAASRISALSKSAAVTASLTKSTSKIVASPPVYIPKVPKTPVKSVIPQIPVTLPKTVSPLSHPHHPVSPFSVKYSVTASPLSPPVPQLNRGIKIPVAPAVKHALSYEKQFASSINNNVGTFSNPRVPLITPFNPYTTLFLPQSGGNSYGQLGPIHIPHQIPILNLPFPSAGGYGFGKR